MNYRTLLACVVLSIGASSLFAAYNRTKLPEVNTTGNNVGIEEGDVCLYNVRDKKVECESGKTFSNVGSAEGSLTGTPGSLSYRNYIGTIQISSGNRKSGSGQRVDICADSTCLAQ